MSIFDIIVDAVDGFDEKFEDTLQFLNEKIENAENRKNNRASNIRKRTSSKNSNSAKKEISRHNVSEKNEKKEEKQITSDTKKNEDIISIDIINRCKNKIKEIRELIENFDYASRKSYEDSCTDLEKSLEYIKVLIIKSIINHH